MGGGTGSGEYLSGRDMYKLAKKQIYKKYKLKPKNIPLEELVRVASISGRKLSARHKLHDLLEFRDRGYFKKNFKLGKTYAKIPVSGVKQGEDITKLTELLVYGLISQKPNLVYEAERAFDRKKLIVARKYISPKEVYRNIKNDLENLKACSDERDAKNILNFLRKKYKNVKEISDLLDGVEEKKIDYLVVKMQQGTLHDLFDNSQFSACTFYPDGMAKEDALNYALDKNMGLLHVIPVQRGELSEPCGVAICINVKDKNKMKGLLVDSYEQGNSLRLSKNVLMPAIAKGIMKVARDNKAKFILFNSNAVSCDNASLINYIKRKTGKKVKKYYVSKVGGLRCLSKYGCYGKTFKYLESFEKEEGGIIISNNLNKNVRGFVEGVLVDI